MENTLLDLILLSEKRKNVLLLLLEGPKDIETLKKALNASATAIQPQVKKAQRTAPYSPGKKSLTNSAR